MATSPPKEDVEKRILAICRNEFMSLGEIAMQLGMNRNTVRAGYLYPMANAGKLIRSAQQPIKSGMKYKTAATES